MLSLNNLYNIRIQFLRHIFRLDERDPSSIDQNLKEVHTKQNKKKTQNMAYVRFASGPIYEKEDVSAFLTPNPYLIAFFFTESYKIYLSSTCVV